MICVCGHTIGEHLNGFNGACIAKGPDGICDRACKRFERSDDEEGDVDLAYYRETE